MTSLPASHPSEFRREAPNLPPLPSFPDIRERDRDRERQVVASFAGQASSHPLSLPTGVSIGSRASLPQPPPPCPLPPSLGLGFASTSDPEHSPSSIKQQPSPLAAVRRGVTIPSDPSSKSNPFFGAFFERAANGATSPLVAAPLTAAARFLTETPSACSLLNSGTFCPVINQPVVADCNSRTSSSVVDAEVAANSTPVYIPPLSIETVRYCVIRHNDCRFNYFGDLICVLCLCLRRKQVRLAMVALSLKACLSCGRTEAFTNEFSVCAKCPWSAYCSRFEHAAHH
jgi:hypothetical protein